MTDSLDIIKATMLKYMSSLYSLTIKYNFSFNEIKIYQNNMQFNHNLLNKYMVIQDILKPV